MIIKQSLWPAELTLSVLGGKWKALVMYYILCAESLRFGELKNKLPGISVRILSKALRELEMDGLLTRMLYPEMPPRSQYTASTLGRTLVPVLEALIDWGDANASWYGVEQFKEE